MSTETSKLANAPTPVVAKRSIFPTLLDYGVLILLAVLTALSAVIYLTQNAREVADQPSPRLVEILKS